MFGGGLRSTRSRIWEDVSTFKLHYTPAIKGDKFYDGESVHV